MVLMTLDIRKDVESKRASFYHALMRRGWIKITQPKVDTVWRHDHQSDPDQAHISIREAAEEAEISFWRVDFALLVGRSEDYREY